MVSFGAKQDVSVKLWNVKADQKERVNEMSRDQSSRHKGMAYSSELDLFAILTATSEILLVRIGQRKKR